MSGVSLIACTTVQTHLNSEVCPIPNNGNISYALPPAKKRIIARTLVSKGMMPFGAVDFPVDMTTCGQMHCMRFSLSCGEK